MQLRSAGSPPRPPRPSASASRARSPAARRTLAPRSAGALAMRSSSVCATCLPRCPSGSPGCRLPVGSTTQTSGARGSSITSTSAAHVAQQRSGFSVPSGMLTRCDGQKVAAHPSHWNCSQHPQSNAPHVAAGFQLQRGVSLIAVVLYRNAVERGFAGGAGSGGEVCCHESKYMQYSRLSSINCKHTCFAVCLIGVLCSWRCRKRKTLMP